ncbi:MAG: hypothetical protein A2V70_16950 [Planctomycetes bacterium RBG_13_63_9]|nr:MAG: hypothetical protein A2V70_16950 [Planctomycetes bacterium RBG_13_63_9]
MLRTAVPILALALALCAVAGDCPDSHAAKMEPSPSVPLKAHPFNLKQVRLLDGPFKAAMELDRRYLHELESDRLLHMFRVHAGLPSSAEPLGGWEKPDCELRGHTLGHYLSACALMVSATGDEELKAKADAIVAELAKCQAALGDSGYLSAFPESWFDRAEACQPVWAPYYTLHKICAGLLDMHVHCDNQQALDVLKGIARWIKGRTDRLDEGQMQRMLDTTEQGGMNDVLANLYAVTGDADHLALARRFNQRSYNDPLAQGQDKLEGQHVNSFIPNVIGTARQYELTGNQRDRTIAEYFWNQVVGARCYCTGGTSNHEHWRTDPHKLATELGPTTQETCCTYNMLKLTRHLFCWTADPRYADYDERALWNGILATQNPDDGMAMYYVPLASGFWKVFSTPRHSFWCCTGTGMENHAKYGDSIYFHDKDALLVNLLIASEVDWKEMGVKIRQETNFPEQQGTTLIVGAKRPVEFTLRVRVPWWATRGVQARLNGKPLPCDAKPSTYLSIRRTWTNADRVEIDMPMDLYAWPMPDDKTLMAFMVGPLVLAGELGTEGLTPQVFHGQQPGNRGGPVPTPWFLVDSDDLTTWIKPVEGNPLTFRTQNAGQPDAGQPDDVTLTPFYRLFGQRYAVYWHVYRRGGPEHQQMLAREEARARRLQRIVDECKIGDRQSEQAHALKHDRSQSSPFGGRVWRHAHNGWFSYELKVLPDEPMTLACTYWGDDAGQRTFDVLVEGQKIATQTLNRDKPGEFFEVEYRIPEELTRGKEKVTVRFQAHPDNTAGGVFGCAMLKAAQ